MATPFFSIIMPCYNDSAYIPKSLSAIAAQTFQDFEIIFVNDASTDESEKVLFDFMKANPSLAVHYWKAERNQGASLSKNQGMSMAQGEYILFNDADDWMDSDHLEIAYEHLRNKDLDILIERCTNINENGEKCGEIPLRAESSRWIKIAFHGAFFKRSLIVDNHICFRPDSYFDDFYLFSQINSFSSKYKILPESHYNFLIRNSSFTHKDRRKTNFLPQKLNSTFSGMTDIIGRLTDQEDRDQYVYACILHYYSVILAGVFPTIKDRWDCYRQCKAIMREYYPGYLKNSKLTLFKENGYVGHFKKNIWLCAKLEQIDGILHTSFLMNCMQLAYHIAIRIGVYRQH